MRISTGLITSVLSTRIRTSLPIRSRRYQLTQSAAEAADHAHCQLGEALSSGATCWFVSALQVAAARSDVLGVRRVDLRQGSPITAQTVWMCSSCLSAALRETASCCVHFNHSIRCLENAFYYVFLLKTNCKKLY